MKTVRTARTHQSQEMAASAAAIPNNDDSVLVSLPDPPTDGITGLSYIEDLLASTSWDGCIRIHDTKTRSHKATKTMESGPLLSLACSATSKNDVLAGGLNGNVMIYDMSTHTSRRIGRHLGNGRDNKVACSCLSTLDTGLVASAGWDARFHLWDVRCSNENAVVNCVLPAKAYSMDSHESYTVVVATANRRICVFDLRNTSSSQLLTHDRESSLKYQTRTLRLFPDGTGFALGSIEGRVAIEYLDEIKAEQENKKKYAFKCHRVGDTVYPVNAIVFHPIYGTFATGEYHKNIFWILILINCKRFVIFASLRGSSMPT